jgi:hypothetical protein
MGAKMMEDFVGFEYNTDHLTRDKLLKLEVD